MHIESNLGRRVAGAAVTVLAAGAIAAVTPATAAAQPAPDGRIAVCHVAGGGARTIQISAGAERQHAAHGDAANPSSEGPAKAGHYDKWAEAGHYGSAGQCGWSRILREFG